MDAPLSCDDVYGRWLHELSVGWLTPLDGTYPTVAEFLGERGYATAGFIANTYYCASGSGLARGFTRYHDFIFPELTALKTAVLVSRALEVTEVMVYFTEDWLQSTGLFSYVERVWRSFDNDRKRAVTVNRELIRWLSERNGSDRPFFAFLNYFDAHYPYQLPTGRLHRFGVEPTDKHQRFLIQQWRDIDKSTLAPAGIAFAADAYDDCIADLDEQLGRLIDELEGRKMLENTWLIITSDHGESFGEHAGVFCHGTSLYDTEVNVPLLVVPPAESAHSQPRVIKEPVSSATWRRRSSSLPVNRRARRFPEHRWRGSGAPRARRGRASYHPPCRSWPRSLPTTLTLATTGERQTFVATGGGQGARVVIYSP